MEVFQVPPERKRTCNHFRANEGPYFSSFGSFSRAACHTSRQDEVLSGSWAGNMCPPCRSAHQRKLRSKKIEAKRQAILHEQLIRGLVATAAAAAADASAPAAASAAAAVASAPSCRRFCTFFPTASGSAAFTATATATGRGRGRARAIKKHS